MAPTVVFIGLIITTAKSKPDMLPARAYFVAKPYSQAQIGGSDGAGELMLCTSAARERCLQLA